MFFLYFCAFVFFLWRERTEKKEREREREREKEKSCSEVERVFVKSMGLDWKGAAALSGVHTLGSASVQNSGYDGAWLDPENSRRFDNAYYVAILAGGWVPCSSLQTPHHPPPSSLFRSASSHPSSIPLLLLKPLVMYIPVVVPPPLPPPVCIPVVVFPPPPSSVYCFFRAIH